MNHRKIEKVLDIDIKS